MIHISDINEVKITRVRPWAICFNVGDQSYLLKGSSDLGEPDYQTLYEREVDSKGHYELTRIKTMMGKEYVDQDYIPNRRGKTIVYSQVDIEYFVFKLTLRGFACGIMEAEVKKSKQRVEEVQAEIDRLQHMINTLRRSIERLR